MGKVVHALFVSLLLSSGLIAQVNLTDSNLPIILIETSDQAIQDEPKVVATMKIIDNGPGSRNQITDPPLAYNGFIGIEFRGASSQGFPKRGYGLETRKEDGSNRNIELFGMPKENDWVLHGPFSDKSLIRNALAYKLAGEVMPYAPRTQFCELMINGNYRGVYLFTEKIKIDKGRVNINKLSSEDNSGDRLTGGYIVKIDKTAGGATEGWNSSFPSMLGASQRTYYQYHHPSPEKMTQNQQNYIRTFITDFENTMADDNFSDSLTGFRKYIDPASFIDFILLNEMCKNVDAYRLSTYLHKDIDSVDPLLKAGPVWDFNLGFGNVDFCAGPSPEGWVMDYNNICPEDGYLIQFWWPRLLKDETFGSQLVQRWRELRIGEWSDSRIEVCINNLVESLSESQVRNFEQWNILGEYVWPNAFIGDTYLSEIEQLRSWLNARLIWMDDAIEKLNRSHQPPTTGTSMASVYPNPFSESLTFKVFGMEDDELEVAVYSQLGQVVFTEKKLVSRAGLKEIIWKPREKLAEIYFYRIFLNREELVKGIIFNQ